MRRWFVAPVVALCGVGLWAEAPASASSTVTVTVDVALAIPEGAAECTPVFPYPTCMRDWAGVGLSLDGARLWDLSMTISSFRPCFVDDQGTWQLTASDGSGDGLSGTLHGRSWEPLTMVVTGGTGAYAGAVDVVPTGQQQAFEQPEIPTLGLYGGCGMGDGLTLGVYAGSLEFNVTLPS